MERNIRPKPNYVILQMEATDSSKISKQNEYTEWYKNAKTVPPFQRFLLKNWKTVVVKRLK
jgi:hypothetical protein